VVNALALATALAVATFVPTLQSGDTVPAIPLVDQSGRSFSIEQLHGNTVVLSFIYTRCPDPNMCPLVSSKFARLQAKIGTNPIRLVEITLDPRFDTPRVLRTYGQAFRADPRLWTLATGTPSSIDELATRLGIATRWTTPTTLIHTEAAIVLDRDGRIAEIIDGNAWTPDQVLAVARAAAGIEPSPVARIGLWLTAAVEACGGGSGAINALEGLALLVLIVSAIGAVLFRALRRTG
jgi:cytochrome oxidase Cu insertion factor (SCO1/SenC/PrrC family)